MAVTKRQESVVVKLKAKLRMLERREKQVRKQFHSALVCMRQLAKACQDKFSQVVAVKTTKKKSRKPRAKKR